MNRGLGQDGKRKQGGAKEQDKVAKASQKREPETWRRKTVVDNSATSMAGRVEKHGGRHSRRGVKEQAKGRGRGSWSRGCETRASKVGQDKLLKLTHRQGAVGKDDAAAGQGTVRKVRERGRDRREWAKSLMMGHATQARQSGQV